MGSGTSKHTTSSRPTIDDSKKRHSQLAPSFSPSPLTALSTGGDLSLPNISSWEDNASSDPRTRLARILCQTQINTALTLCSVRAVNTHIFNTELGFTTGPVTNQKNSGRCWLFAACNILRYQIMKTLKLSMFELSQSYLFFYDKLEKANFYLEQAIELAHLPLDDRLVYHLANDPIPDGGQWDMLVNIVEKYGVVPLAIFPESANASNTGPINTLLKTKLREHALILRRLASSLRSEKLPESTVMSRLRGQKEELMSETYRILSAALGVPPMPDEIFLWEYHDNEGKVGRWEGTPKAYFEAFWEKSDSPNESFSLIHDPRNEYSKLYTVDRLGNVWGGRPVLYVNTGVENLKAVAVKMIKAGHPVFFGCDVDQFSSATAGILDPSLFEYENTFNITFGLTKAERLQVKESLMTHAMVISAVHLDGEGNAVKFKVENSWGDTVGKGGYFVMTEKWFDEFVYQIVVPRQLAPKDLVEIFDSGSPIVLPPWDPMGALA